MFWFFGQEACGILAPPPGIEPTPPALEGEVLTTGPPGKSLALLSEIVKSKPGKGGDSPNHTACLVGAKVSGPLTLKTPLPCLAVAPKSGV